MRLSISLKYFVEGSGGVRKCTVTSKSNPRRVVFFPLALDLSGE